VEGLGRLFDLAAGVLNVDVQAGAATGNRVSLRNAQGVAIIVFAGFSGDVDALNVTLQEHDAASGGNSQNLAVIDHYYLKSEATLDGDEVWTRVDQTAAATLAAFGTPEEQKLLAIEVDATQLSDGFAYVSLNIPDQGAGLGTKVASVLYLLHDLVYQRAPELLDHTQV
jgi:hypothetical protein